MLLFSLATLVLNQDISLSAKRRRLVDFSWAFLWCSPLYSSGAVTGRDNGAECLKASQRTKSSFTNKKRIELECEEMTRMLHRMRINEQKNERMIPVKTLHLQLLFS